MRSKHSLVRLRIAALDILTGPSVMAFVPDISLAAFWMGGEVVLILVALGLPLLFALAGAFGIWQPTVQARSLLPNGMLNKDQFSARADTLYETAQLTGGNTTCFVIALDDFEEIVEMYGQAAADLVRERCAERLLAMIRHQDIACWLDTNLLTICLTPSPHLDLQTCIQMSGRMQGNVEEPIALQGTSLYVSCSIGFCMTSSFSGDGSDSWIEAAQAALDEARRNGPSTIRAYTAETRRSSKVRASLRKTFSAALSNGEIRPWFQPQVSTDTGKITGFEALARWEHPVKGVLGPQVFLPFAEQAGLLEQLGKVMRHHAMEAMTAWDRSAIFVPRIGVNFASDELRNPALIDRLKWELDQFELTPDRLAIEVLETVFSRRPDDVITRNLTGLADLGCCIDLDDFGTGHASIASIKRFNVSRIKIDRSFVAKADHDPGQQQLVSAILTLAERLNLETLAEGVETPGEHALLAQLGCDHVQGFGIGRPIPFDKTMDWITAYQSKIAGTPGIGHKTG